MASKKLPLEFFARSAEIVARDLLGRTLVVSRTGRTLLSARIREVAAYESEEDSMYKGILAEPGVIAISTKHGKRLFDISTNRQDVPSCVTLIAANITKRGRTSEVHGPGNLTRALDMGVEYDGATINSSCIWIEGESVECSQIKKRRLSSLPRNCKGYFYFR